MTTTGWYVCGMCGYLARTWPWTTWATKETDGVEVTEEHKCPRCGDQWWLMYEGFGRDERATIARLGYRPMLAHSDRKDATDG